MDKLRRAATQIKKGKESNALNKSGHTIFLKMFPNGGPYREFRRNHLLPEFFNIKTNAGHTRHLVINNSHALRFLMANRGVQAFRRLQTKNKAMSTRMHFLRQRWDPVLVKWSKKYLPPSIRNEILKHINGRNIGPRT